VLQRFRTFTCVAFFVLMAIPTTAHAWWDIIEEFSGPRKFKGPDIQFRLFCVVETNKQIVSYTEPTDQSKEPPQIRVRTERRSEIRTPPTIGMLLSICPTEEGEKTKLAFDLGVRFMWSGKYKDDINPAYGDGQTIFFSTLEPTLTFPLVLKNGWRLEYGFGAGVYWFSSEGFDSFRGFLVEPARVNLHVPLPSRYGLILSVGALVFPAGFEPTAFAGDATHSDRIAADLVPIYAIAADLTPAAKALADKLKLRWAE
jgi:hypothetical protein